MMIYLTVDQSLYEYYCFFLTLFENLQILQQNKIK